MSGSNLAGRYAKALFELASDSKASDKVEGDLIRLLKAINENSDLIQTLKNPSVSKQNLEGILNEVLKKIGGSELTNKFVLVILRNGRIKEIAEIATAYAGLMMQARGEEIAYITTAFPLDAKQVSEIETTIGTAFGHKVKAVLNVDENILGGIVVRVGSKMLDASVSGKLDAFANLSKKNVANLN